MLLNGPERYSLSYTPQSFAVLCNKGTARFSGLAVSKNPKLYIASVDGHPIYVGITKQKMQSRLRYGWSAAGAHGYHGYAWRHSGETAVLDVWEHADAIERDERDVETIEAEVVYLIRQRGQWPAFQTEIHFYPSNEEHRELARKILAHYYPTVSG